MNAIVIGATGAVGRDLLEQLLADPQYDRIDVFGRRDVGIEHPHLHVHIIDFEQPEQWAASVQGDVLFSCLGTTLKLAGSQQAQWRVDHDYQLQFAQAAAANGVGQYVLVSSMGASAKSLFFYSRMKGALEDAVKALPFAHVGIVQPPSLIRKGSDRWAECAAVRVQQALNRIGLLRSFRPMPTESVAAAMRHLACNGRSGVEVLRNQEIVRVLDAGAR